MSDLSVPTLPLRVTLSLTSGATLDGDVFLPAKSPVRDGPMLASEWASLAPAFIPLRLADGGQVTFVATDHIVAIALPPGVPAVPDDELVDAPVRRVRVETVGGASFEGLVTIAMPIYQQRVNDWLNNPEPNVTIEVEGRAYLLRKSRVIRITEIHEV